MKKIRKTLFLISYFIRTTNVLDRIINYNEHDVFRMPYSDYFGGVVGIKRTQFELANGFSNKYWGWGGEDDEFLLRIEHHNLGFTYLPLDVGRYHSLLHYKQDPNPERYNYIR